jgi:uncharacterized protein YukE
MPCILNFLINVVSCNIFDVLQIKLRRMTIVEQEKVMTEKVQKLEEMKREYEAALATLKAKDKEVQELNDKFEECMQKLRESRDKIRENENGRIK